MQLPNRLYKYEPFTAQSLQNLKDQVIYFGSPRGFNDPYDCALTPRIKEPSDTEVERVRQHYLTDLTLTPKIQHDFQTMTIEDLRRVIQKIGRKSLHEDTEDFLSKRGVSCFSEVKDSLLMWSHYGDSCKGFCLEFRTDREPFQKTKKVTYTAQMPQVDVVQILCDGDQEQIGDLYCTKAEDWSYEREWRCIHGIAGTPFIYHTDTLTGVFLGPDMPFSQLEIIAMILGGQNDTVQLWKGSRSTTKFLVEFEPITYTSHLEAKRKGLVKPPDA
jgi:hypothetical protein